MRAVLLDSQFGDQFAYSVAIDGNTAVVGAKDHARVEASSGRFAGAAYVFVRSGATWTQQAELTGTNTNYLRFGTSVAITGSTIVVGEPGTTIAGIFLAGTAFVFDRSGTRWTRTAQLNGADLTAFAGFGSAVDVNGDTALVGAPGTSIAALGAASYVFTRSGAAWTQRARLTASDSTLGDSFGSTVALSGDTAVVGAPYRPVQGASYVFARSGTTWTEQAKLITSDATASPYFGASVDVSETTVLVGAPNYSGAGGAAYVFVRYGTAWSEVGRLKPATSGPVDRFGAAVALDLNGAALIGDYGDIEIDAGVAWAYYFTG